MRQQNKMIVKIDASHYSKIFWLENLRRPKSEAIRYHIYGVFDYDIPPDFVRLAHALQVVVNTNYNLRSTFQECDGKLIHVIHPHVAVKIEHYVAGTIIECQSLTQKILQEPFNLENGPLFRFAYVSDKETRKALFIPVFHHIIIDGTQFDALMEEISKFYSHPVDLQKTDIDQITKLQSYIA
jgi:NRPS condensation-like uncharacterized protein